MIPEGGLDQVGVGGILLPAREADLAGVTGEGETAPGVDQVRLPGY